MCWSAEVSLNTFIFGVVSFIFIYTIGIVRKQSIIIIMSFTLMQLLEYFAWTYIENKKIIKIISYIGLHLIFFQILLLNYFLPNKRNSRKLLSALLFFYIIFMIFQFKEIDFTMEKGINGHLEWRWFNLPIIWVIIILLFYLLPTYLSKTDNLALFSFTLITIIISFYYYYKAKTWGTMWCYFSNILWLFFIIKSLVFKFKKYKK